MTFWKQFRAKSCSIRLKSDDKEEILREIVGNMVKGGTLDPGLADAAIRALLEREQLASTGLGMNVAIPHVKLSGLVRVAASLSIHPEGAEWAAVDGEPVQIFFTVLRPETAGDEHDPERHLDMMRWLARLARDADFRSFALQAKNRTELVELLKEMAGV